MLTKENIKNIYSLTPMQKGMLFHNLYDTDSHAYFEQLIISLEIDSSPMLFEKAFNNVLKKYDIFRTIFSSGTGVNPRQIVLKDREAKIDYRDITYLPQNERELYFIKFKEEDKNKGFNLSKDILIRLTLIKMKGKQYKLVLSFHHILIDGWCMKIILTDLFYFYGMQKFNQPLALEEMLRVKYPYHTYIKWLEEQNEEVAVKYWEQALDEYDKQVELFEIPINKDDKYIRADMNRTLNLSLTNKLEEIAANCHVTVNVLFQAIWGILLQKYTNQDDVVFGTVVSGRPSEVKGVEEMVGLFINTVPIRFKTKDKLTFQEILRYLSSQMQEIRKIEYYPLSSIQSKHELKNKLINHLFVFENFPVEEEFERNEMLEKIGLKLLDTEVFEQTNYDLNCIIYPGKEYRITFNYNNNRYPTEEVKKLCERYIGILEKVASNPNISLDKIYIISDAEKDQILNEFNNTAIPYDQKSIQELFKEQALNRFSDIALIGEGKRFTYSELDLMSDKVASYILGKDLNPESKIALYFERSTDLIIAILGVVKANCIYVPIDTTIPGEKVKFIEQDCDIQLVVTNLKEAFPLFSRNIVDINSILINPIEKLSTPYPKLDQALYVMYTSGSTGNPKGVLVEQRNVVRLVNNTNFVPLSDETRVLLTGAPGFDATTFEIWGPLLNGGTLAVVPMHELLDMDILERKLNEYQINTLWLTSSLLNQFVDTNIEIFEPLSYLLAGGDALSPSHINRVKKRYPNITIINGYGPTENTTFSTTFTIDKEYERIPIGKPINNSTAYIIDRYMHLQPVGLIGELCVGGDGVARGYLNNPKMTAEKFIKNPLGKGRLYRTGDMAKWLPDGNIDFFGRVDDQIKISGFRIEKGEVEAAITAVVGVKKAFVQVRKSDARKYLIGYYEADESLLPSAVKANLKKRIPDHMIPSYLVRVDEFILNKNGKVDKSKLPVPMLTDKEYKPVKGKIEETIASVWREVLCVDSIGRDDNFYSLGGDSIKAIPIVSRLKKMNIQIDVRDIFQYQTIRELSDYIKMMMSIGDSAAEKETQVTINPEDVNQLLYTIKKKVNKSLLEFEQSVLHKESLIYPVTGSQKGHLLNNFSTGSIPLAIPMKLEKMALVEAFRILLEQQGLLRSTVLDIEGKLHWKEYTIDQTTELPLLNISIYTLEVQNRIIDFLSNEVMNQQFNCKDRLMYAALWIKRSETDHILFLRMHHSLYDVMSLKIIPNSLLSNYSKILHGDKGSIKKPASYQQYAVQMNKGPQNIEVEQIKDIFELEEYKLNKDKQVSLLKQKQKYKTVNFVNYKIPLDESVDEDAIFEISLCFFLKVLSKYFNCSSLPFSILSFGRSYCGVKYYETVGEFIDIVPMCFRADIDRSELRSILRKRIKTIEDHNINFMNMWQDPYLKVEWDDLVNYFLPVIDQMGFYDLVFNFQGEHKEEEIDAFEKRLKEQVESGQVMNSMFSAMAEVKYTSSYIHFSLITNLEDDMSVFKKIMEDLNYL